MKKKPAKTVSEITSERGAHYGHPLDHFPVTVEASQVFRMARYNALMKSSPLPDPRAECAVRHAVYMICDKLARAATDPMHKDNWDDIQGYARCAKMALKLEE